MEFLCWGLPLHTWTQDEADVFLLLFNPLPLFRSSLIPVLTLAKVTRDCSFVDRLGGNSRDAGVRPHNVIVALVNSLERK